METLSVELIIIEPKKWHNYTVHFNFNNNFLNNYGLTLLAGFYKRISLLVYAMESLLCMVLLGF